MKTSMVVTTRRFITDTGLCPKEIPDSQVNLSNTFPFWMLHSLGYYFPFSWFHTEYTATISTEPFDGCTAAKWLCYDTSGFSRIQYKSGERNYFMCNYYMNKFIPGIKHETDIYFSLVRGNKVNA
jgi:hypothetical protein